MKIGGVAVAAVLLAGGAFLAGKSMVDSPKEPAAVSRTTATTGPATTANTANLVEFRDDKGGWAISYPKDWKRQEVAASDPDVALVVSEEDGRGSIKVRDVDL